MSIVTDNRQHRILTATTRVGKGNFYFFIQMLSETGTWNVLGYRRYLLCQGNTRSRITSACQGGMRRLHHNAHDGGVFDNQPPHQEDRGAHRGGKDRLREERMNNTSFVADKQETRRFLAEYAEALKFTLEGVNRLIALQDSFVGKMLEDDRYLTLDEVKKRVPGISTRRLNQLVRSGRLTVMEVSKRKHLYYLPSLMSEFPENFPAGAEY